MNQEQAMVRDALQAIVDSALRLPDGNSQFPSELGDALGEVLCYLSSFEDETYGIHDIGLHKSLRMEIAGEKEKAIENIMDTADCLYCAIFHEVIVPGAMYRFTGHTPLGVDYIATDFIERAEKVLLHFKEAHYDR